jgi:decaprenylphospho-beta-D-ribofuranose 2-oxidase
MPVTKQENLCGWGRAPVRACLSWRPEKHRDLLDIVSRDGSILARGMGRSYGDAALQPEGTVRTERLNHFIDFDADKGIIQAQAGVTLAELMEITIPRGWFPPVIPGTRYVTLGGAFACNVHGKNHFREGDFAEHVLSIQLLMANGHSITCSPTEHRDIFWATAGGMGMTGIIEHVTLKLRPITSASLRATTYRVDSLEDMVAAFEHYRDKSDYMVGWIDHMAKGKDIGRGIFESASHTSVDEGGDHLAGFVQEKPACSVPSFFPSFILNRYSMALYNKLRFKNYSTWRRAELIDFNSFFHPLDRIENWNRLYGSRGFFQYQCLFPDSPDVLARMRTFLTAIQRKKIFSFLAVIKYHRNGKGMMSFSQDGYSLALDFPNTWRVRKVLPQLDQWVAENGGRVYLAKDAMLTQELFDIMYGQAGADWRELIHDLDPGSKFTSLMSQRLGWK